MGAVLVRLHERIEIPLLHPQRDFDYLVVAVVENLHAGSTSEGSCLRTLIPAASKCSRIASKPDCCCRSSSALEITPSISGIQGIQSVSTNSSPCFVKIRPSRGTAH